MSTYKITVLGLWKTGSDAFFALQMSDYHPMKMRLAACIAHDGHHHLCVLLSDARSKSFEIFAPSAYRDNFPFPKYRGTSISKQDLLALSGKMGIILPIRKELFSIVNDGNF